VKQPRQHHGTVILRTVRSRALGIAKQYYLYLPPDYHHTTRRYPVLYLFRGHEREWVNPYEDDSRGGEALPDMLDAMIASRRIRPMIVVMPGLNSNDNGVPGLGINMLDPAQAAPRGGIGTGLFEEYLVRELLPSIDAQYRTIPDRNHRGVDGFSLGGYTAILLAVKFPQLFASAGSYDGTLMWKDLADPRNPSGQEVDHTWMEADLFDAVFGRPRNRRFMTQHNPANLIAEARGRRLHLLRTTAFHIQSAAFDGDKGNIDRTRHFVAHLHLAGMVNTFKDFVLSSSAVHSWKYADLHMRRTLPRHDAVFHQDEDE
jgi:S-formylglutathione hydrolase FrmB